MSVPPRKTSSSIGDESLIGEHRTQDVLCTKSAPGVGRRPTPFARPIKRPAEISGDTATSESAWLHAVDEIEKAGAPIDIVVAVQATSPLRESSDIERALGDFEAQNCDSLFSCGVLEDFFIWEDRPKEGLRSLNYDSLNRKRRQDVAPQYVENGSFYLFKPFILRTLNNRLGGKIGLSKMAFWKTFEVDSYESFEMCEALMRHYLVERPKKQRAIGNEFQTSLS